MKLLAIDTATEGLSIALLVNGEVIEHYEVAGREHSTRLPLLVPKLPRWYLSWLAEQYSAVSDSEALHDLFLQTEDFTVIRHIVHETDAITAGVIRAFPAELSPSEFAMLDIVDLAHVRAPVVVATLAERPIPAAAAVFISEVVGEIERLRVALQAVRASREAGAKPG